jgi:aminoglycoside phosphotransferase (APT) family kinase protein
VLDTLGRVRALRALPQGMTSSVALADTDGGLRVIKRARGALFAGWLEQEYRALTALTRTALPTPAPRAFVSLPDLPVPEAWLVMDYLPGRPLSEILNEDPPAPRRTALLRAFGETLAAIHATPAPPDIPRPTPSWLDHMLDEASENLEHFIVDGTPELLARLRNNPPPAVAPALIHGDYTADNVLVEGDRVTGIIDWSGCAVGDPRYDVALATRPQEEAFDGRLRQDDTRAFLEGYGRAPVAQDVLDYFVGLYEFF